MKRLILSLCIILLLTRCAGVVIGGAAVGAVAYDSRSFLDIETDARIFHVVHTEIVKDKRFAFSSVDVSVFNQVVLLTGQVSSAALKVSAEKIARRAANVDRVYDQLEVDEPISISQKAKDKWITTRIMGKMLTAKGLRSGAIKIVTNDGIVYLMGIVKKPQAAQAVSIARKIDGVKKVVKVFQLIPS